jgi:hypothetical protein
MSVNFGFEPLVFNAQSPTRILVIHRAWMS